VAPKALKSLGSVFAVEEGRGAAERGARAAALFLLFASGSVLALLAVPFTDYLDDAETVAVLLLCALSAGICVLIALAWRHLPDWTAQLLLAGGTLIVTTGTYVVSEAPADTEMFYIWVALFAAYFFTRKQAAAQIAFVGACYAVVLALDANKGNEVGRWLITMGSLLVTAALFAYVSDELKRRLAARERSERELEASLSLLEATLESTADGILVVDNSGAIVGRNRKFQEMWRIPDEVVASGDDERALAFACGQLADPDQFMRKVRQLYDRPEAESYDVLHFKDGRAFERYSQPQRGRDGTVHGRVWSFRDITERERIQSRLRRLAERDALTGLLNRRRFEEELSRQVAHAARYGNGGAVLLLDLDDFKVVNDSLGHRTGDVLLASIAELLRARLRESDILARLGGDEFAILLPKADEERARAVAESLLDEVRRHRTVFRGRRVKVTTSIGIAVIDGRERLSAEDVLVRADVAMYAAKGAGRDGYSLYRVPAGGHTEHAGLTWPDRIHRALEEERFRLFAQPILDLRTNRISQYELLIRMEDTDGELLPPGSFLPTAERSGLIEAIDTWVAQEAIRLIAARAGNGRPLRLEINLSGRTLGDSQLPALVERELAATAIDPAALIFEVTETAATVNLDEARAFATALTSLGCGFALDDFGAGFGSFYYLKYLPVDMLKIDGDFIGGLAHNRTDQAVVQAIVELSHNLGLRTVAESVGDAATLAMLRDYGVDFAQGHHVGPPEPVESAWEALAGKQ
jgi:diguanylate cyclase (GGDEF)-like protein/PAS domain S-box-containing protein